MGWTAANSTVAAWSNLAGPVAHTDGLDYLFLRGEDGSLSTPPSGMRSSVPLGPLGEGSVELRVDGRLARWGTVFNNGPYTKDVAWAHKIDIDEAVLGVSTATLGGYRAATMLRTHPPHAPSDTSSCPSVEALAYQGGGGGGASHRVAQPLGRGVTECILPV